MHISRIMRSSACAAVLFAVVGGSAPALAQNNLAPAAQRDIAKEEHNRAFVINFYDLVFNKHDLKAAEDMVSEGYIQHNPHFPTGRPAFIEILAQRFKQNPKSIRELFAARSTVISSGCTPTRSPTLKIAGEPL
jgi:hypothetical protein